jgi:hypothetical protein
MRTEKRSLTVRKSSYIVALIEDQVISGIITDISTLEQTISITTVLKEKKFDINKIMAVQLPMSTEDTQTARRATETDDIASIAQELTTHLIDSFRLNDKPNPWIGISCGILDTIDSMGEKDFVLTARNPDYFLINQTSIKFELQ